MAYTLKASGIATNLVACVAVDQDGTVKEFVATRSVTLDTGVAASVTASTWKGATRSYFETTANGTFNFNGVRWAATQPVVVEDDADGMAVWFACAGASANTTDVQFVSIGNGSGSIRGLGRQTGGTNKGTYRSDGTPVAVTTTSLPTDGTTKFSFGASYRSASASSVYYGLESGSLSQEATAGSDGGFGGSRSAWNIGGVAGQGNQPFKPFVVAIFNKQLSTAEMQSLHGNGTNDWTTTLFDAPAAVTSPRAQAHNRRRRMS